MLDTIKRYSNTWVAKILMGLLILSFGLFGIANVFTNLGSTNVARVGNQSISAVDFERAYRGQLNNFAQQTGQVPTPEQAVAFGIPGSVITQLAGTATVDNLVENFGVGASDDMVAKLVAQDPNFSSTLGLFDRQRFNQILAQSGYTESEYVKAQAGSVKRNQIVDGLFGGLSAPKTILEISNRYENDSRTLDYFTLGETALGEVDAPTEEELTTYLADNQRFYRTQETRNIDILVLTPATLAKTITVSDADIEAEYAKTGASFISPETRDVKVITLNDAAQASVLAGLNLSGSAFDNLLSSMGLSENVQTLGQVAQSDIEDADIATAAFANAAGISVVPGETANKMVVVSNIVEGGAQPLDQVRDQVAQLAAERQAKTLIADKIDEIEELRATLAPIKTIADQFGLTVETIEVTSSGGGLIGLEGLPAEAPSRLLPAIAAAEQDKLLPAVTLGADSMAWFDLNSTTQARDQTLEEVRLILLASWIQEKNDAALDEKATELVTALNDGGDIFEVASTVGQIPLPSLNVTRQGDGGAITAQVAAAAFQGGEDYIGSAKTDDGNYVIFKVSALNEADPEEVDQELLERLGLGLADNVYQQFIAAKREDFGFSVNQTAINQLLALSSNTHSR
ncbi:peptidylprolyl isomerase [Maritalea sp.]|uniref:peptidylprolyl isomerase n=1 Tax=Maritalea sp. TaxID=2003361 RepID=UPI003EF27539